MVDPAKVTNYNLDVRELEEVLLFWVLAAGKNGTVAAKSLDKLMRKTGGYILGPFNALSLVINNEKTYNEVKNYQTHPAKQKTLEELLIMCGIGCYTHKARTIRELVNSDLDLRVCPAAKLETIYGIGMKTSRCFILHSRYGAKYAGLDTHVLKFLDMVGVDNVPKRTPSSKKEYIRLETAFLRKADLCHKTPAELDLLIWNELKVKVKNKVTLRK